MNASIHLDTKLIKALIFIVLIIIALIISLSFYHYFFKTKAPLSKTVPDAIISGMNLIKTDIQGKMSYRFLSEKAFHYQENNRTNFIKPIGYYYPKNQPYWKVTADKGNALNGDQIVHLLGNVRIHQNAGKNNHEITLTTTKATLLPKEKIAKNNVFVKVTEPGTLITAVGFRANMALGKVTLLSQVKGHFIQQAKS